MAKSLHELSRRTQISVFVTLCVLTAGATRHVLIGPEQAAIRSRRGRVGALDAELVRARGVAAGLPAARRDVRALEAWLRDTEAVLPEETDPQDVLRDLHDLASDSLLDISSFRPKPMVSKADHTEWPIELGLEGSYHDIGRFFDRIANRPRLMSLSLLDIKTKTRPSARGTVSATCIATTFVFQNAGALEPAGDRP